MWHWGENFKAKAWEMISERRLLVDKLSSYYIP